MALQNDHIIATLAHDLKCSICLEVFLDPVTSACGRHNYCKKCLTEHLDGKKRTFCPECREQLPSNYTPRKNVTLCKIVDVLGRENLKDLLSISDRNPEDLQNCEEEYNSTEREQEVTKHDVTVSTHTVTQDMAHSSEMFVNALPRQTVHPEDEPAVTVNGEQDCAESMESIDWPEEHFAWITFSPQLGHSNLVFSEGNRRVEVQRSCRASQMQRDRFSISQVMAEQEFAHGMHYWDVDTTRGTSWAIGVAYSSLGQDHYLGRTAASWCLEWNNQNLSYWHNKKDESVKHRRPNKVRVSLNLENGSLSFHSVCDGIVLLLSVTVQFTAPVRPAFWLYGRQSGNSLSFTNH